MNSLETTSAHPKPHFALLPLRLVAAWMFLSAFHRRVILDPQKLVADAPGYVGVKFNQFMPGAIFGVGDMIAALLDNRAALHGFLWSFTIIEGLVGLALLVGLATRLAGVGVLLLSAGILFGAGWLGPTCLDEWQIGSLGIAGGAAVFLGGPGGFSVDEWLARRHAPWLARTWLSRSWVRWAMDPAPRPSTRFTAALALGAFGLTLATNQIFHGGLWGTLHNDSVRPRVDVIEGRVDDGDLLLTLERNVGPETYGAFVIDLTLRDGDGRSVLHYDAAALSSLPPSHIDNRWLVRVRPGAHGLVVPLGARATLRFPAGSTAVAPGRYRVELKDVSGAEWSYDVDVQGSAPPSEARAGAEPST